jgi:5'-methylthioadenosine phosphorylase
MGGQAEIGVIGGSGLYEMDIEEASWVEVGTPFGEPSDAYRVGVLEGRRVAFLARHGRGHRKLPSEIPFRANIYGLKSLGVTRVLAAGAVGSLREEIHPVEIVVPDQFIDRTRHRPDTFFGEGIVVHVAFADPFCPELRGQLLGSARALEVPVHDGGT